ncbi:MAG: histidine phosphotransferase family protein [Elsteraceae bacterium]
MSGALSDEEGGADHSLIPLALVQLLVGRALHDLSGPAGALANGVEMAVETGALDPAVADLLTYSAESLLARLRLLGFAFGRGDPARSASLSAASEAARKYLLARPLLRLSFPEIEGPAGFSSLLPVLVMTAADCLPKQGEISVEQTPGEDLWRVTAAGPTLRMEEGLIDLLEGGPGTPNNRSIAAYMACRLAAQLGRRLAVRVEKAAEGERLIVTIGKSSLTNTGT